MKRWICFLLSIVMALSLCACQSQSTVKAPTVEKEETEETEDTVDMDDSEIIVDVGGFGNPDSEKLPQEETEPEEPDEPEEPKKVTVQIESSDTDFTKIKQIGGNIGKKIKLYGDLEESDEINELAEILGNYSKNISLVAMSLKDNKAIAYNTKQGYFSACTIKIAYILSCCKQIDEGLPIRILFLPIRRSIIMMVPGRFGKKNTERNTLWNI